MREELERTIEAYNQSAQAYIQTIAKLENYDETYEFFAHCLKDDERVLDLACGPANISLYLLKRRSLDITGIDLSARMIELAREVVPEGTFLCRNIIDYKSEIGFDAAILGFAVPYLNRDETETLLRNTYTNLRDGGCLYLSFMDGEAEGFERPSFNTDIELYIHYHPKGEMMEFLKGLGFSILKEWLLDYHESDGSITTDVVLVAEKGNKR